MEYSQKTPKTPLDPLLSPCEGEAIYVLRLAFLSISQLLFNIVVLLFSGFVECINNAINKTTRQPTTIFRADTSFGKYQPLFMQFFNGC